MRAKKNPGHSSSSPQSTKKSPGASNVSKVFYLIMLLLILSSSFIRISGANRRKTAASKTPTPTSAADTGGTIPGVGETAAISLSFHYEDSEASTCEDLTIASNWNVVYSDCTHGIYREYTLTSSEQTLLQDWLDYFQQVEYDHPLVSQTGSTDTQLFLNGVGTHPADDAANQQIENFAKDLVSKIIEQS